MFSLPCLYSIVITKKLFETTFFVYCCGSSLYKQQILHTFTYTDYRIIYKSPDSNSVNYVTGWHFLGASDSGVLNSLWRIGTQLVNVYILLMMIILMMSRRMHKQTTKLWNLILLYNQNTSGSAKHLIISKWGLNFINY